MHTIFSRYIGQFFNKKTAISAGKKIVNKNCLIAKENLNWNILLPEDIMLTRIFHQEPKNIHSITALL